MKVFLDTNVVMEVLGHRKLIMDSRRILEAAFQGGIDVYMSAGGVYTISYLLGIDLKNKDIHEPDKTAKVRELLADLLNNYVSVIDISHDEMVNALEDKTFRDLEDSYQYYCAIENGCDALVTINIKHFKGKHNEVIPVFTPSEFVKQFIEVEDEEKQQ